MLFPGTCTGTSESCWGGELGDLFSEIFDADKPVMKLVMLVELSKCLSSILEIHTASEGVCFSPFITFSRSRSSGPARDSK